MISLSSKWLPIWNGMRRVSSALNVTSSWMKSALVLCEMVNVFVYIMTTTDRRHSATPLLTRAPAGHDIINYHKCKQCQSQSQQLYKTYNSVVTEQGGVRCARGAYHSLLKK